MQLRKKFKDRLLGLIDARANLLGVGKNDAADSSTGISNSNWAKSADDFNGLQHLAAAGKDPAKSANKIAMKFLRDCAPGDPEYLYPHEKVLAVPGAAKRARLRARSAARHRQDRRPRPGRRREFRRRRMALGAGAGGGAGGLSRKLRRFRAATSIPLDQAFADARFRSVLQRTTARDNVVVDEADDGKEIPPNAAWRRMTADDAADAGALALAMNNATNNASLVLAFELSKGGKVLLFVGDAQAGNWRSWSEEKFDDDGNKVTAKDLLGRTVLYKVGHHGSHNATLKARLAPTRPTSP